MLNASIITWTRRVAIGGAWIFCVGTWLVLAAGLVEGVITGVSNFRGDVLYVATSNGQIYQSWGLTYRGASGYALLAVQAVLIFAAIVSSCSGSAPRRRTGLLLLCAWSALWMVNATWIYMATGWERSAAAAGLVFFCCTLGRAVIAWNRRTFESGPRPSDHRSLSPAATTLA